MADRIPLKIASGQLQQFQAGDTISATIAPGAGGSTPTGTGFRHVTAGVEDAASKLVDTVDVNVDQITYAKMQNVSAASKLVGRGSAGGAGDPEEITLGTNLSMSGTTLNAAGGGGATWTTVEKNLGTTAVWRGKFTITDAAIGPTSKIIIQQAPGPYTGKGTLADEDEMNPMWCVAAPASGSATVRWQTLPMLSQGIVNGTQWILTATNFNQQSFITAPKRLGKVRGNVKFTYSVAA